MGATTDGTGEDSGVVAVVAVEEGEDVTIAVKTTVQDAEASRIPATGAIVIRANAKDVDEDFDVKIIDLRVSSKPFSNKSAVTRVN